MSAPVADATAITTPDPATTSSVTTQEPELNSASEAAPVSEPQTSTNEAAASSKRSSKRVSAAPAAATETEASPAEPSAEPAAGNGISASPSTASKSESAVRISLLLSSGNRHPFTVNNKFLQRHNIQATDSDPWNIRVYDMKTLIWHEWLSEWETKPTSPALIRLIFLGGLLDDKAALKDCRLSKTEPNVVHMTVKPQDLLEDDEVKGKEQKQGPTRQRRSGGGCCVIL